MPSLTLNPPNPSPPPLHSPASAFSRTTAPAEPIFQAPRPASPVAPAFSPITPKLQPNLPVKTQPPFVPPHHGAQFTFSASDMSGRSQPQEPPPPPAVAAAAVDSATEPPAQYMPPPPNMPFSSEDASDAIALRAAISTLQFQKKKAQDDLRQLQNIKRLALDDPDHFKTELAAGKLKEHRPTIGNLQAILDAADGSDDEAEVVFGAPAEAGRSTSSLSPTALPSEIPDSQPSESSPQHAPDTRAGDEMDLDKKPDFPRIPGPQSVVRMPYVNWDKYGVVGEPLDSLHDQQRRWPGTAPFGHDRGQQYAVAAPYSPFLDTLDAQHRVGVHDARKDSALTPTSAATISEHPMETRSRV